MKWQRTLKVIQEIVGGGVVTAAFREGSYTITVKL